jgi:hypothetical protein
MPLGAGSPYRVGVYAHPAHFLSLAYGDAL